MASCSECLNLTKRLKVLQNDYQFEIKKLAEDQSNERVLFELAMNKEVRILQEKFSRQQQQRKKDNEMWLQKVDSIEKASQAQVQVYSKQKDQETQKVIKQNNQEVADFKHSTVGNYEQRIRDLEKQKNETAAQLQQQHAQQIRSLKSRNDQVLSQKEQSYAVKIKSQCSKYEAQILGLESEKNVEKSLHTKTKEASEASQARLYQQIFGWKRRIADLEEKNTQLKQKLSAKETEVEALKNSLVQAEQSFKDHVELLQRQNKEKQEEYRQGIEEKLHQFYKKELQNCDKYERALEKIQEHRQKENSLYKANLEDIKGCVEDRPSRLEDVEEIVKLKERLIRKQRQCQTLFDQMKWYKLELQNKEETYNKIFGPESIVTYKNNQNIYIRRRDMKLKRAGKSLTGVREVLGSINSNQDSGATATLAPLMKAMQKKSLPPKSSKLL